MNKKKYSILILVFAIVSAVNAQTITVQPSTIAQLICKNGVSTTLSVTATGSGLTYQWFNNSIASKAGATLIPGATGSTYTPPTTTIGIQYYFCQVVPSVSYGGRTWMKSNLDVVNYNNGDPIPLVTNPSEWATLTTGAYCYVNNDGSPSSIATNGLLYNWFAVNDPRGIAPIGWHVATGADFNAAGGFTGNRCGFRRANGNYDAENSKYHYGYWWTSEKEWTNTAWMRMLDNDGTTLITLIEDQKVGFAVRCVKN